MTFRALAGACAIATLLALAAPAPSLAADIPTVAGPPARAPVMVAAPARNSWYGSYIGIHGGYGFGNQAIAYTPNAAYAGVVAPGSVAGDPRGYVAGITYGTNFQFGGMVLGTESDFSFSGITRTETLGPALAGLPARVTGEQEMKYFSSTRARGGFLLGDHVLIFGTGGLASGSAEASTNFNLAAPAACAGICPAGSRSKTLWGWTAGGGLEFAYGPWSLKADYLYYDLGKLSYNAVDPALPAGVIATSTKFSGHVVRGGLNYRFNWTFYDLFLGRW